jgi:hypothetical protein
MTQYFTVLSLIQVLNEIRPLDPKVEIVFQDPSYTQKDRLLISQCLGPRVRIVDNPEAFALIHSNTLVFSPYVPISVPVLQICADVGPPAGIFTNKVRVSEGQR